MANDPSVPGSDSHGEEQPGPEIDKKQLLAESQRLLVTSGLNRWFVDAIGDASEGWAELAAEDETFERQELHGDGATDEQIKRNLEEAKHSYLKLAERAAVSEAPILIISGQYKGDEPGELGRSITGYESWLTIGKFGISHHGDDIEVRHGLDGPDVTLDYTEHPDGSADYINLADTKRNVGNFSEEQMAAIKRIAEITKLVAPHLVTD